MTIKYLANKLNKIPVKDVPGLKFPDSLLVKTLEIKSRDIYNRVSPYITGKRILDIGTGIGGNAAYLYNKGYEIESVDIDSSSLFKEFPTKIYNGLTLPYPDNSFDTALIIHVLHHCSDRLKVLREAIRTSKRVIFIEDTYRNRPEWLVVSISDMLGNNEFHFHRYSTPKEWGEIIQNEGCKIIYEKSYSLFTYKVLYGRYVLFVIEKK